MNFRLKGRDIIRGVWKVFAVCALLAGIALPAYAADSDGDNMPDDWEIKFGLSETNSADALMDSDSDGLTNLYEYAAQSDPLAGDTDRDGVPDGSETYPVSRAYIKWGDMDFTDGDAYDYTAPSWLLGAYRVDGEWSTNPVSWYVPLEESNDVGSLNVDLNREILTTNNIRYRVRFFDSTSGMMFMDLLGTNGVTLVTNLFGNIQYGSNTEVTVCLDVPLATYTNAAVIHLRRGSGETRVYESLIYIDEDNDGLDRELEQQLGTSDYSADSDGDGLSDYDEVFVYGTDPANPDTDGDGMSDGWEVLHGLNPKVNDAGGDADGDGVNNLAECLQGRDPLAGATNDTANVVNLKVYTTLE
ncbi:MAG: hypothetical protein WC299_02645 [Kiritimatiellia bacterium]